MSTDKLLRIRIWTKVLLIVSVVLFLIGVGVLCCPAVIHEQEMNQDALDYAKLSGQTQKDSTDHPILTDDETVDEPLPLVTLVPALEISDMPDGDHSLQELLELLKETNEDTNPDNHASATDTDTATADRDLKALKAQNADFAGWLSIAGTNVDYPVVCSDNTDYYLTHTFNGTKSSLGTLFSLGKTSYSTSKNIAIYGHHITGSGQKMFKPLLSYKDKSFWRDHRTIVLDTLSGQRVYTIFAVINMENGSSFPVR